MAEGKDKKAKEAKRPRRARKAARPKDANIILRLLRWIRNIFLVLLLCAIGASGYLMIAIQPLYAQSMEQVYDILAQMDEGTFKRESTTKLYDKDGNLIGKLGFENYEYVEISKISPYVQKGYIDVEDKTFKTHSGVNFKRTIKSTLEYFYNKYIKKTGEITEGGSTITQQVIKNNLLTQDQTVKRKVLELMIAMQIDSRTGFSKAQIMEFYCNSNYYGNGCYGIEGASQYYFGKSAASLDLAQAAMLVGTSNRPNDYNPAADYEACMKEKTIVLGEMLEEGDITREEFEAADKERPELVLKTEEASPDSYMVSSAIHDAALKVMESEGFAFTYTFESEDQYKAYKKEYDKVYGETEKKIRSGGYTIYTSFDQDVQSRLQEAVDSSLEDEQDLQEDGRYDLQAAAVVIDNKTGLVVAAVGGRGTDDQYNRSFMAARQSGSSIKPLLDYGPALNEGAADPASVFTDEEIDINGYKPGNYGGGHRGDMTVREALARSVNTIAVQLFSETGSQTALSYLGKMKFSTLTFGDSYNTAISLGGFTRGVTVEDMCRGYACVANQGRLRDSVCVTKVESEVKGTLYEHDDRETEVFSEDTAFMLTDMMEGVFYEDYGTGRSAVNEDAVYAGKSGTADDYRDAWFGGFSAYYTTVVWTGCDTPRTIDGLTGSSYPLDIWSAFMDGIHEGLGKKELPVPDSIILVNDEGKEKKVDYKEDIFFKRPEGYDYTSRELEEKTVRHEVIRRVEKQYKEAQEAVEAFEDFQITSVDEARRLEEDYQAVLGLISDIEDPERRTDLQERAEYKYSLLSGEVKDKWMQLIEEDDRKAADERDIHNQEAAQESEESAISKIRQARIDTAWSYIGSLNDQSVYTDETENLISGASEAVDRCSDYSEYGNLKGSLDNAISYARGLPTGKELQDRLEAEYERKRQQEEAAKKAAEEEEKVKLEAEEKAQETAGTGDTAVE